MTKRSRDPFEPITDGHVHLATRFLPKQTDTGDRLIGPIPRDVWEPAAAVAKARGENLLDVVERTLRAYGREQ